MSSSKTGSHLQRWLPKLEQYMGAIHAVPSEACDASKQEEPEAMLELALLRETSESQIQLAASIVEQPILSSVSCDREWPAAFAATQPIESSVKSSMETTIRFAVPLLTDSSACQISHLPIDGILKRLHRSKSFVLGIGSIGLSDPSLVRSIVIDLVKRCSSKTDRKALLVTTRQVGSEDAEVPIESDLYQEAAWTFFGESKADTKAWHAQLGALPRWKQEFGLIVVDLGDTSSPQMLRIGRLCDGIGVQLFNSTNSRETIRALASFQKEKLPILGVWSVGTTSRKLAA